MKLGSLEIDETKLIARNMAIIGATDSGKSYSAKKLVIEAEKSGIQVIVLDLEGEYEHPTKEVSPKNTWEGRYLGEYLATHKENVRINFSAVTLQEIPSIAAAILNGLYDKRRRAVGVNPVLIIVDEAYFYAPEAGVPGAPEVASVEACERILFTIQARGRHRGIGTIIITQRPQYVRKHVLAQCQYWLVFRLNTPPELRWIREQGYSREIVEDIAQLPQGTCYAIGFNGPIRVDVPP